ncbi:MAG: hypothetical protein OXH15_13940 [Gammaproteobacteria bacterium]|nr:hypothetical protein [Gammaproteobacteria bacterium]
MKNRLRKRLMPVALAILVGAPALEAVAYWCEWNKARCVRWEDVDGSKILECTKWKVKCYG